jgi:heme exporter protein A
MKCSLHCGWLTPRNVYPARAIAPRTQANRIPPYHVTTPYPPATPRLRIVDLACRRAGRLLFQHLAFDLPPGRLAWVRGHNGRGKTSLLRVVAGLSSPDHGEVLHDGQPVQRLRDGDRPPVYIGHANALKDDLSATEALRFLLRLHGRAWDAATAHAALQRLGLPARHQAREGDPALWILDEPFDALDADGVVALNGLLADHLTRSGSVLLTSHLPLNAELLHPTCIDLDAHA